MLALIGPDWLNAGGEEGRRLENDDDWVRHEIRRALERKIALVPVLINDATVPPSSLLPDDIANLVDHHAVSVRTESHGFRGDMKVLFESIEDLRGSNRVGQAIGAITMLSVVAISIYFSGFPQRTFLDKLSVATTRTEQTVKAKTEKEQRQAAARAKAEEEQRQAVSAQLNLVREIQTALKTLNCYKGPIDGKFESGSRSAWYQATGRNLGSNNPTYEDLRYLKSLKSANCQPAITVNNENRSSSTRPTQSSRKKTKSDRDGFVDLGNVRSAPTF